MDEQKNTVIHARDLLYYIYSSPDFSTSVPELTVNGLVVICMIVINMENHSVIRLQFRLMQYHGSTRYKDLWETRHEDRDFEFLMV